MFTGLKVKLVRAAHKAAFQLAKKSPEICVIFGGAAVVAGFILIAKAAPRAAETTKGFHVVLDELKREAEEKELSRKEVQKLVRQETLQYGWEMTKIAGPAVGLELLGLASIGFGFGILKKRSLQYLAAYNAVSAGFRKYRDRVIAEQGEDADLYFLTGAKKHKVIETVENPDGTVSQVETEDLILEDGTDTTEGVVYGRFFDEFNNPGNNWTKDPLINASFLNNMEILANSLLETRGFLYLNEVYQMIGYEPTWYGGIVGWLRNGTLNGIPVAGKVDFRVREIHETRPRERSYFLDFNCDGVITDHLRAVDRARNIAIRRMNEQAIKNLEETVY